MTTLFQSSTQALNYAKCRPVYPLALYEKISDALCMVMNSTPVVIVDPSSVGVVDAKNIPQKQQQQQQRRVAVDVGCGTGQATVALANAFTIRSDTSSTLSSPPPPPPPSSSTNKFLMIDHVIGIDPSLAQIEHAIHHPNVSYRVGCESELMSALATTIVHPNSNNNAGDGNEDVMKKNRIHVKKQDDDDDDDSTETVVSLITAAQAAHWFDMSQFYNQVDQLFGSNSDGGGVLAVWTYGNIQFLHSPYLEKPISQQFYHDLLKDGGYWDERRQHVDDRYINIPTMESFFPNNNYYKTERIEQGLDIEMYVTQESLLGYLRSWSGYVTYCTQHNIQEGSANDPIRHIQDDLSKKYESLKQRQQDNTNSIRGVNKADTEILNDQIFVVWPVTLLLTVRKPSK